jgi:8-oxo-dGTP pyrophosphatase MutT (NUDIX family)
MEQRNIFPTGATRRPDLTGERIAEALSAAARRTDRSDATTSHLLGDTVSGEPSPNRRRPVPAAVLVPLVDRDEALTILLTRRTAHLANHAGQISFPGGRIEESDADAVAAALRETEEEIGLKRDRIEILGRLDDYLTVTGFEVVPVVGLVRPPFTLSPDRFEVDDVFEMPLAFALDPRNFQRHWREARPGERRYYYAIPFGDRYVWGATAAMLMNLCEVLSAR